jgi:hypothetical protein
MLTVSTLRSLLTAAIGREAGKFIDALQARRMLPDEGTALTPRSVIVALLALVSGEETDERLSVQRWVWRNTRWQPSRSPSCTR